MKDLVPESYKEQGEARQFLPSAVGTALPLVVLGAEAVTHPPAARSPLSSAWLWVLQHSLPHRGN